ncbi:hypothetical protein DM194_17940 (plasmid) [Azospirillum ramasamyi]|uniref:Uncharacterized protein n=1 Tax=Azospirillum ramasamyi TaxID=682998 RepID=A0A2U9S9K9_9PROT|nr:hypothetical protein DM194_17940 [Azospirillum ramasamyi]
MIELLNYIHLLSIDFSRHLKMEAGFLKPSRQLIILVDIDLSPLDIVFQRNLNQNAHEHGNRVYMLLKIEMKL